MIGMPGLSGLGSLVDVMVVSGLVYTIMVWARGARAHFALMGIGMAGCVYVLARQLGLALTAWIFQAFFAVLLIVLVVVFQRELRQLFERIAVWGLHRQDPPSPVKATDVIVETVSRLVANRQGALIVVPGRDPLERHLSGGIALRAEISEPLLLSLFDPNSPGHDGAVLISGARAERFAAYLPLSTRVAQLGMRGTRHAAALGLAERTDALCVVVSEERGEVSVARWGSLRVLSGPLELTSILREFSQSQGRSRPGASKQLRALRRNWRELALATTVGLALWFLVVPRSKVSETVPRVPVVVENLPAGYIVDSVSPPEVDATVTGFRRDLALGSRELEVVIDAVLVQLGKRAFQLSPASVRHAPELSVTSIQPKLVVLSVKRTDDASATAALGP